MSIKPTKKPTTITVQVSQDDFDMIHQFAHRAGTSVSQLTIAAILRLMNQVEAGDELRSILSEFGYGIETDNA